MTTVDRPTNNKTFLAATRAGLMKSTALVAVALAASMALAPVDASAQQRWDGVDTTSGNGAPIGGPGTWDGGGTGNNNWTTDATGTTNTDFTPNTAAIFGTVGGAVTVSGAGQVLQI